MAYCTRLFRAFQSPMVPVLEVHPAVGKTGQEEIRYLVIIPDGEAAALFFPYLPVSPDDAV